MQPASERAISHTHDIIITTRSLRPPRLLERYGEHRRLVCLRPRQKKLVSAFFLWHEAENLVGTCDVNAARATNTQWRGVSVDMFVVTYQGSLARKLTRSGKWKKSEMPVCNLLYFSPQNNNALFWNHKIGYL
jgi:hypothetical protein